MSQKTILVIDDSATIRRLVDSELGGHGYRVVMAANAEDGIMMAMDELPDLVLLDHQLPGTTGYEVCCQLIEDPQLQKIPVVVSSTLRKKAYAEYTELSNVIDMLPKPYTPDLLRTTIANALDTAAMVVQSQSSGTAVPEVINELADGDLSGSFKCFSFREVIDFLNNSAKPGMLEIDLGRNRVAIYLSRGRIQAVTASGIEPEFVSGCLPTAISDLAPMVKFTMRGGNCSEIDGLVELLDNKVLDARLLKQLLRHQAAVLINHCCESELKTFRFESAKTPPELFAKLPLDISFLAIMVDACLVANVDLPDEREQQEVAYTRQPQRGQNLDRAGLSAQHMKLLNAVSSPATLQELSQGSDLPVSEIHRVLLGFVKAELVSQQEKRNVRTVIAVTADTTRAQQLTDFFNVNADNLCGKVVRDVLAVKLLLRRVRPDLLLFDLDVDKTKQALGSLRGENPAELRDAKWLGFCKDPSQLAEMEVALLSRAAQWPADAQQLAQILDGTDSEPDPRESANPVQLADCT